MRIIDGQNKGASTIEYIMLIVIISGALFIFKDHILRAFNGRWKSTGDSFGMGRQYKPGKTSDCTYFVEGGAWYDTACYQQKVSTECVPSTFLDSGALRQCEDGQKQACITDHCK